MATDEGNSRNENWNWTNDEIGVAVSGCGFKSHSGQLSMAALKNPSVIIPYVYIYIYIHIYIYIWMIYIYMYNIYIYISLHKISFRHSAWKCYLI